MPCLSREKLWIAEACSHDSSAKSLTGEMAVVFLRLYSISNGVNNISMHKTQQAALLPKWQHFLETSIDDRLTRHKHQKPEEHVLALFHSVAEHVPAYRSFLHKRGIQPDAIRTADDFRLLPLLTKQDYISAHSLPELCWHGTVHSADMVAVSSGSTGTPTFWPRSLADELEITSRFEQVFYDSFRADKRSTLAVVCFPLGTWVGGMFTANCCRLNKKTIKQT